MFRLKLNLKVALFNNTWIPDYLTGYWKSFKDLWRCLKICMKILVQIFEDLYWKSSKIFKILAKILKVLVKIFVKSSLIFARNSDLCHILSTQIFARSSQIFPPSSQIFVISSQIVHNYISFMKFSLGSKKNLIKNLLVLNCRQVPQNITTYFARLQKQ